LLVKVDYKREIRDFKEVGDSDEDVHRCTMSRSKEGEMTKNFADLQIMSLAIYLW